MLQLCNTLECTAVCRQLWVRSRSWSPLESGFLPGVIVRDPDFGHVPRTTPWLYIEPSTMQCTVLAGRATSSVSCHHATFCIFVWNEAYKISQQDKNTDSTVINGTAFTALHVMQTRYSDENSVRPSIRPSVCHTRELWQNGRKICPDFYTMRKII